MNGGNAYSKARIDKGHGFMKSIIRNQIDRDNYDKEVKAKQHDKPRSSGYRSKKPEVQKYRPPIKKNRAEEFLFVIEFEDKDGEIYRYRVLEGDDLDSIVNTIADDRRLPASLKQALYIRLEDEYDMRISEIT